MNILVLFSYGSLTSMDEVPDFYRDIYHGHAKDTDIARGTETYRSYGMPDPLGSNMRRIKRALVQRLENETGEEWISIIANRHTSPTIEEAAKKCAELDPKRIVTLSLNPFDSLTGNTVYARKFENELRKINAADALIHAPALCENRQFIEVLTDRAQTALDWLPGNVRSEAELVFTLHSKPGVPKAHQKMITQYETVAEEVSKALGVNAYHLAYRSGRPAPERWLGPDVLDVVEELHKQKVPAVLFIEVLSVVQNLEAVHEVTTGAVGRAREYGMEAVQSEYLNDSADFVEMLGGHLLEAIG